MSAEGPDPGSDEGLDVRPGHNTPEIVAATSERVLEVLDPVIVPERRDEAEHLVSTLSVESRISIGPLPSAEELAAYERLLPGLADRLTRMAEKEQEHRHATQVMVLGAESKLKLRGQPLALLALAIIAGLAALFLFHGAPKEGATIAVGVIVLVVAMFLGPEITKLVARRQEREATSTEPADTTNSDE